MYTLAFHIDHRGCWVRDISRRFSQATFALRASVPIHGRARDILAVRAETPEQLTEIAAALSSMPTVQEAILLDATGASGFFLVEGREGRSLIEAIMSHEGFLHEPTLVREGIEHWRIGLAYRERAKELLDALTPFGTVTLESLSRDTFPDLRLTAAQGRALKAAIAEGYYDVPRRTSPTKLAQKLGIAKSTLLEHLQRAESKAILANEWMI